MKFVEKTESREQCTESGWFAWDYRMDGPLTSEFIRMLRPLGGFTYLSALAKPFFKIEGDYYLIKGIEGSCFFRAAVHGEHLDFLAKMEAFINRVCSTLSD